MAQLFGKRTKRRKRILEDETVVPPQEKEQTQEKPKAPVLNWQDCGVNDQLVAVLTDLGIQKPTKIQRQVVPFLNENHKSHVLAISSTGSGKTVCFLLPIFQQLVQDPYGIFGLLLAPTRELAKQIHQQIQAIGSSYRIQSALLIGGLDRNAQLASLQDRPHLVVGTPGRTRALLDLPDAPRLKNLRYLVLDEADRLLAGNSGFEEDLMRLLHMTKEHRPQTLLFSATMSSSLQTLEDMGFEFKKFVLNNDPPSTDLQGDQATKGRLTASTIPEGLQQEYIFLPERVRDAYIVTVVMTYMSAHYEDLRHKKRKAVDATIQSLIVFCGTCERVAIVSLMLEELGLPNVGLHSVLSQPRRLAALGKFQSQQVRILVATDVAARGLDIPSVDLVLNAELPREVHNYVHRVGRTARAGRRGRAISLVTEHDVELVASIERVTGRKLEKNEIEESDVLPFLGTANKLRRMARLRLNEIGFDELLHKFKRRKAEAKKERRRRQKQQEGKQGKVADA